MKFISLSVVLSCILFLGSLAVAAPEPAIVQKSSDWTLDVQYEPLTSLAIKHFGQKPQFYWYTVLSLTNNSKDDVEFYPSFEIATDTQQIISAEKDVTPAIFEKVKKRYKNKYPLLESVKTTSCRVLQGEDNSKDIVIIWPDFDKNAKTVSLYLGGLSNETIAVDHPTEKDQDGKPKKVYLRKTLELTYTIAGDSDYRPNSKVIFKSKQWVMR
jgi:hypothetical protein